MSYFRRVICWFTFWQWLGAFVFWVVVFKLAVDVFHYDLIAYIAVSAMLVSVVGAQLRGYWDRSDREQNDGRS